MVSTKPRVEWRKGGKGIRGSQWGKEDYTCTTVCSLQGIALNATNLQYSYVSTNQPNFKCSTCINIPIMPLTLIKHYSTQWWSWSFDPLRMTNWSTSLWDKMIPTVTSYTDKFFYWRQHSSCRWATSNGHSLTWYWYTGSAVSVMTPEYRCNITINYVIATLQH